MKLPIPSILLLALVSQAPASDLDYRSTLNAARERFRTLDIELNDYRKRKPELTPPQEAERLQLLGQLLRDDPVWAVLEQLRADVVALAELRPKTAEDSDLLESLKDMLAIASGIEEQATTRTQAETFATTLRQFIARRDVNGVTKWVNAQ